MTGQRRQFVLAFLAYLVQRDVPTQDIAATSGLSVEQVLSDANIGISEAQLNLLWNAATDLTHDPLFGLHLGESFQLSAIGAVGEIIKTSKTVGEALTIAATFTPVITTAFGMEVRKTSDVVRINFIQTRVDSNPAIRQIVDFLLVFTTHELNGLLLRKILPTSIVYPFRISSPDEYLRIFRSTPTTKDDLIQIDFPRDVWDTPIITADFDMQRNLLEKLAGDADQRATFQAKIMDYLLKNSFRGILSLEDVAANFNTAPRSLQRKLQDDGTTFQQIADTVRKTLALHYLEAGHYKMKEISTLLGYNEVSAFSRAFKRWTGKAPGRMK